MSRPRFEDLPLSANDPAFSAWGLWGKDDELGTLNLLSDEIVAAAAKTEIRTGKRISLDWPLDKLNKPSFGRQAFHQELLPKPNRIANDDVITLNTQASSQWDGLRHFAYQKEKLFYNNRSNDDFYKDGATKVNGVQVMSERGGICGRGVLIDHVAYALRHDKYQDGYAHHSIPLGELLEAANEQGVTFQEGDILFVRQGYTRTYDSFSEEEQARRSALPPSFTGVETGPDMAKWIWDNKFSAVVSDTPSFEAWPPKQSPALHEILLAGWGCPIGELFDLESLAAHCEKIHRWTFFLASIPLNNPGGAASPPNAVAIF